MKLTEYVRDVVEGYYDHLYKPEDSTCWLFVGAPKNGYGQLRISNKDYYLHRITWAHYEGNGEIPDDMVVHHTCNQRLCCNPDHLVLLTKEEHLAAHAPSRFCSKGHDTEKVGRYSSGNCAQCGRIASREYQRNKRKANQ